MEKFFLKSSFKPAADQPQAIAKALEGLKRKEKNQTLLGVTGSGKTFTMAHIIAQAEKPALIISHNKVLAAQLYGEFKSFFPQNHVEYFISYYDYYQPEAYLPQTDLYIEKDASINQQIDRLRLKATSSILNFKDTIVIASVSSIYNIGSPKDFFESSVLFKEGNRINRREITEKLISLRYERNETDFSRGKFRLKGNILDIFPGDEEFFLRIIFSDTIEKISKMEPLTAKEIIKLNETFVYPATHFISSKEKTESAIKTIEKELKERYDELIKRKEILYAERLKQRTLYDLEMLKQAGFCHGIENYSMHLTNRKPKERPLCLLDYFKEDFLLFIDESHVTLPQIRGMYEGDRARKQTLVDFGFRLPSALENRPLKFDEFINIKPATIFVSATPADYELKLSKENVIKQVLRPTGLADPEIEIHPLKDQIKIITEEIEKISKKKERALILTLTKKNAKDLSDYLRKKKIKAAYIHSDMDTFERLDTLDRFKAGEYFALVGINMLREGLDIPEISLVAILNADNEGFLRSETTLIQISGRAARNKCGKVLLFADTKTKSIKNAMAIMSERRALQLEYNKKNNITPKTIAKKHLYYEELRKEKTAKNLDTFEKLFSSSKNKTELIEKLDKMMRDAADNLDFEKAAAIRDKLKLLKEMQLSLSRKKQ